ncbi:MAG: Flp pilus assembly complex ATPase component TadA, partial [Lentisphaerae bacterium]|nr:Flp pilus assembly complex ATPase component TadA [Lentisphaerota bacterium]
MLVLTDIMEKAVELDASDIHIKIGSLPFFRVRGELVTAGYETVSEDDVGRFVREILPPHLADIFRDLHEADFSRDEKGIGRFRVNLFHAQGRPALVMRHVKADIPTFEGLRLPLQLKKLANIARGIVILSGTTGSGKSTTLAAIVGEINRTQRRRIITVEDPVEYLFHDDQAVITQREVGLDTPDYDSALTHLMRQDPDII